METGIYTQFWQVWWSCCVIDSATIETDIRQHPNKHVTFRNNFNVGQRHWGWALTWLTVYGSIYTAHLYWISTIAAAGILFHTTTLTLTLKIYTMKYITEQHERITKSKKRVGWTYNDWHCRGNKRQQRLLLTGIEQRRQDTTACNMRQTTTTKRPVFGCSTASVNDGCLSSSSTGRPAWFPVCRHVCWSHLLRSLTLRQISSLKHGFHQLIYPLSSNHKQYWWISTTRKAGRR